MSFKKFLCLLLTVLMLLQFAALNAAAEQVSFDEYNYSMTVPESYTVINKSNINENIDIIEGLGYTKDAFLDYIEKNNIIMFAVDKSNLSQLSLKTWETEFSKQALDFCEMSDDTLDSVAKQLVKNEKDSYTIIRYGDFDMIQIRRTDKDSGGAFCSVQYVMLRNGRFFSLTQIKNGELNDSVLNASEKIADTVKIKNGTAKPYWNFSTITQVVFIWAIIIIAVIAVGLIIASFIKDKKRKENETDYGENDYIERRK